MKRMLFLGALVLGVTVCSQSFGFEILDRMLGCRKGGASCTSCSSDPGCAAGNGCADACEPGCGAGNGCLGGRGGEPGCGAGNGCAEPACDAGNGCCDSGCTAAPKCRKKHSLFGGLKGLFENCKRKSHGCTGNVGCDADPACGAGNGCADACEPACGAGNGCLGGRGEPGCGAGNGCGCNADPGCGAGNGCAEPACGAGNGCADAGCTSAPRARKAHKSILAGFFKALHSKKGHKSCTSGGCTGGCGDACEPGCGADPGCGAGNGCGNGCVDPACGAVGMIESAPTPNATAARKTSKMVQVSRTVTAK